MKINHVSQALHLYKYRDKETTKLILKKNSMKFSRPNDFNDPFDCRAKIEVTENFDNIIAFFKEKCPDRDASPLLELSKLYKSNPQLVEDQIRQSLNCTRDNVTKICCYSEVNNNILMWSHYGENHTGTCLKFEIMKDIPFFNTPYKVHYTKDYPSYNYNDEMQNVIFYQLSNKAIDWKYEEEVRVIKLDELETLFYSFKKESLVEIIFGCCSPKEYINEIISLCKENGYDHVAFKQAVMKEDEYVLEIDDFKP